MWPAVLADYQRKVREEYPSATVHVLLFEGGDEKDETRWIDLGCDPDRAAACLLRRVSPWESALRRKPSSPAVDRLLNCVADLAEALATDAIKMLMHAHLEDVMEERKRRKRRERRKQRIEEAELAKREQALGLLDEDEDGEEG